MKTENRSIAFHLQAFVRWPGGSDLFTIRDAARRQSEPRPDRLFFARMNVLLLAHIRDDSQADFWQRLRRINLCFPKFGPGAVRLLIRNRHERRKLHFQEWKISL